MMPLLYSKPCPTIKQGDAKGKDHFIIVGQLLNPLFISLPPVLYCLLSDTTKNETYINPISVMSSMETQDIQIGFDALKEMTVGDLLKIEEEKREGLK